MKALLRIWATLRVAVKRLFAQRWLAIATALGLVMSVGLALSIPMYADAVYYRVLREELWGAPDVGQTDLPLTLMFRYIGGWEDSLQWEAVAPADDYVRQQALATLRLPPHHVVRHFRTDTLGLFPADDTSYAEGQIDPLTWTNFAFNSQLAEHVTVVEGAFPAVAAPGGESTVEVLVSEALAQALGVQVGERYVAFGRYETGGIVRSVKIPVRVAGIWQPSDPASAYWFADPAKLEEMLFVPEATFTERLADALDNEVYMAIWHLVLDGSEVHARDVGYLVARILTVQQRLAGLLPNTRLDTSPMDALREYWRASNVLTILLYAFSVPILGLILAFIGLVVSLMVGRQRNEIAVLRSRGATVLQVVGIAGIEALLLGAVALAAGLPVGENIAHLIGRARSFLDFSIQAVLRVEPTTATLTFGLAAVGLALLAQVAPTLGAARHTIVTYKQDRARTMRKPWWQRFGLDALLLIPAIYGGYLLRRQGSIALPVAAGSGGDPFQNPLLFLVPSLGVFALTLFILRFLPLLMNAVAWIAAKLGSVGFLMAARHLARTPSFYTAPLVLLVLTLSLSTFVASLAQTFDHHLHDQRYYRVGADMRLVEQGEATGQERLNRFSGSDSANTEEGARWLFLPVSEHLRVPGVRAAARVGRFRAFENASGSMATATFIGVDRVDFAQVAFWREDFAERSLGALMNGLALKHNGVLISRDFARRYAFSPGDTLPLAVDTFGQRTRLEVEVVGVFDLFPTWYPGDEKQGALFVGNLDYLFERAGGQFPYDVWLETAPGVDHEAVAEGVRDLRLRVQYWEAPEPQIFDEQRRPERQGLFGVLSVGFVAAALLTALGFLLYAFFSFRRRFIELGVLRAIGLSARQMTAFLAWELAFLVLVGLGAGTGLGAWISNFFIPYLQVGAEAAAQIPPYVVEISWPAILRIYALFGLLFVAALGVLIALLLRMKIFQAIKLGETA